MLYSNSLMTDTPIPQEPVEVTQPKPEPIKHKEPSRWRSALSTIAILLIAPLLAISITVFVFQSYEVDGPSMQSTLQNRDRLIIWKLPRTWARITKHDFIPKRGDVIVFIKKGLFEEDGNKEKQLIKRVIALPGERVTVKAGVITVYNAQYPEGFNPDKALNLTTLTASSEGADLDVTVPAGEVYVCGDNRGNSLDSRYFGPVPEHDIIGKLVARILPFSEAERF